MTIRQKVISVTLILIFLTIGVTSGTYYSWYLQHPHEQNMQGVGKDWMMLVVVVAVVMGAIGTAAAFVLSAHLASPITTMVETANAIANGDFNRELTIRRRDETGQLVEAFRKMKNSIDHILEEMAGLMLAIREGKLDSRGNAEGEDKAATHEMDFLICVTACQTPCITLFRPAPLWLWAPTNQRPSTGVL